MKKQYPYVIAVVAMQLLLINVSNAQTLNLKPAPAHVTIDGNTAEWGDSLSYYNSQTQLNYTLANDKDNLYLVLKTQDLKQQANILSWGVTLGIDTKGHKKPSYSVTFPVQEQDSPEPAENNTDKEKKYEASLTKLKRIKADGFKDVENDVFTLQNTYGFRVAIDYDAQGALVYEEVIPLSLFHADEMKKNEWAFNIKINGPQPIAKKEDGSGDEAQGMGGRGGGHRGGGGGSRGGAGGGGYGGGRGGHGNQSGSEQGSGGAPKSVDFWSKFILAS